MDEAHKMDADLCNNLLNLHQIISPESPFMLVLAGTPGLRHFLSGIQMLPLLSVLERLVLGDWMNRLPQML